MLYIWDPQPPIFSLYFPATTKSSARFSDPQNSLLPGTQPELLAFSHVQLQQLPLQKIQLLDAEPAKMIKTCVLSLQQYFLPFLKPRYIQKIIFLESYCSKQRRKLIARSFWPRPLANIGLNHVTLWFEISISIFVTHQWHWLGTFTLRNSSYASISSYVLTFLL